MKTTIVYWIPLTKIINIKKWMILILNKNLMKKQNK